MAQRSSGSKARASGWRYGERYAKALLAALLGSALAVQGCQAGATQPNGSDSAALESPAGSVDRAAQSAENSTASGGGDGNVEEAGTSDSQAAAEGSAESSSGAPTPGSPAAHESFSQWLDEFRAYARGQGVDAATLERALAGVTYQPRIIELDRYQPEFTRAIWDYLDSAVSDTRVSNGRDRLAANRATAEQTEARYGVPPEIITAIWGVESNYGSHFGSFSTIEALATLGYDGRRHDFAREQLVAALKIIQRGDIAVDRMQGSWAGAMGHTQFIPTSFLAYAVDGDGDGRRDIWGSIPDVMASTAHYLAENGWRRGERWGAEVTLPASFDYSRADADTRMSTAQWRALGVSGINGAALPKLDEAAIIAPAGAQGPAFMVGHNFRVIMRYNNATSYALAVAMLGDRIAGRPGVQASWPREQQPLSRSDTRELQRLLNRAGFDAGTPDGIMGPNTRGALRAWQRGEGLTPDGFATSQTLETLRGSGGGDT